jgi:hypothetical protein
MLIVIKLILYKIKKMIDYKFLPIDILDFLIYLQFDLEGFKKTLLLYNNFYIIN